MIEIDRVLISSKGYNLTIMIVFQSGYSYEFDFGKEDY